MRRILLLAGVLSFACSTSAPDNPCDVPGNCVQPDASADSPADAPIDAPAGCVLSLDPKDSPLCIADTVGIFVDGTKGDDAAGDGTKTKPVKSIGKGLSILGGKPRVYVCEGTYPGSVDVGVAVSIYGGLKCDWTPSTNRPVVVADKPAYGVSVTASNVKNPP